MPLMSDSSVMGAVSLWYKKSKDGVAGPSIASLPVDLFLEESIKHESAIVTHPVQRGTDVTTHIKNNLMSGTLKALVSNWSVTAPNLTANSQLGPSAESFREANNRALNFYKDLLAVRDAKQTIEIVTSLGIFSDIAISSIEVTRTGENGEAQEFSIGFKQINRVTLNIQRATGITDIDTPIGKDASGKTKTSGTKKARMLDVNDSINPKYGTSTTFVEEGTKKPHLWGITSYIADPSFSNPETNYLNEPSFPLKGGK